MEFFITLLSHNVCPHWDNVTSYRKLDVRRVEEDTIHLIIIRETESVSITHSDTDVSHLAFSCPVSVTSFPTISGVY